jgi:predicted amidohydrolase
VQCEVGRQLTRDENLLIFKQRPDFVVLPEYYNVDPTRRDTPRNSSEAHQYLQYCQTLSARLETILIAGTTVTASGGKFYNTAYVFYKGELVGTYDKGNPTTNERKNGISPGIQAAIFEIRKVKFSILICADVLAPALIERLAPLEPDIVFIPTTSPYRPQETVKDKFVRDQDIFVAGARTSGGYMAKCCAVGEIWGGQVQGRSLVAAPWGVLSRISPEEEDRPRVLSTVLDISEIREFRKKRQLVESKRHSS